MEETQVGNGFPASTQEVLANTMGEQDPSGRSSLGKGRMSFRVGGLLSPRLSQAVDRNA